jgi:Tfp pilus assembly protein PilV
MFRTRDVVLPANRRRSGQSGMGLIELMIAMVVLMVGMLGSMIMVIAGMQSNTRNRNDTSAVVLDQEILEKFATLKNYPKTGTASIYDCALTGTNQHLAALAQAPAPGAGAVLYTAGTAPTPVQVGEVRWNVTEVSPNPSSRISLLTVSSRQVSAANGRATLFAPPTTLRTLIEN